MDLDGWHRARADLPQERVLDVVPVFLVRDLGDDQMLAAWLPGEDIELATKILGQEATQERHVALALADLEQFGPALLGMLTAEAFLDVAPDHEAHMVGVEAPRIRADHLVVADQKLQMNLLRQVEGGHETMVPVAGPAL